MNNVQYLKYTFGARSSEPISEDLKEHYLWISSCLTGKECTFDAGGKAMSLPSVAKTGEHGLDQVNSQIREYARSHWDHPFNVGVVDIARSTPSVTIRPEWEMGIATAISSLISEAISRGEKPLCIILRRARPTDDDVVWNALGTAFQSGHAVIIDEAGLIRGHDKFNEMIDQEEYTTHLKHARKRPIDLLELKLIRRLGHIRVHNKGQRSYCARHFFDGSECEAEIADLIRSHVEEHYKDDEKPLILYTDPQSEWLKHVVLSLQDCSSTGPMCVEEFLLISKEHQTNIFQHPLLITPVIDTAKTVAKILRDWDEADLPEPKVLTVVSTKGETPTMGTWRPTFGDKEYEVFYLLHQRRTRYTSQCPMCRLEIPYQPSGLADAYLSLTSYDFWDMAAPHSCNPEGQSETPIHREKPLTAVPPIQQMVRDNGPWLAKKAVRLLQHYLGESCLKSVPIVHLKEPGAKPLPFYLRELLGATLIPLPNSIRNELSDEHVNTQDVIDRLRKDSPFWYQQLESVNPDQPVLLLEEFSATGGTRKALLRLLDALGRSVLAHLCVVNFESPTVRRRPQNSFCLYKFELPKEYADYASE